MEPTEPDRIRGTEVEPGTDKPPAVPALHNHAPRLALPFPRLHQEQTTATTEA
jgi:hypothetical protein